MRQQSTGWAPVRWPSFGCTPFCKGERHCDYNMLGQTGLYVSELCLGTMTFGGDDGMWGLIGDVQQRDADTLVRTALDAGINFIDTRQHLFPGACRNRSPDRH